MTDAHTEIQQQIDTDARDHATKDPYLTVIELQVLGILRKATHSHLSCRSMRITLNTTAQKLRDAIDQSNTLTYDAASGTVSLKGENDG